MSTWPLVVRRLAVAPMLDWTDRHCRYFMRLITRRTLLYTEMVTTGALVHGDTARFLRFDPSEHPVALQLGGSDPGEMAACARLAEDWGYDEANINLGCPSERVQSGRFGACLMLEPDLVAECVAAMKARVEIPVTVKTRIGVDEQDDYDSLHGLVERLVAAGCDALVVHARKAWLKGLSPRENRDVPPLRYEVVTRLKADFPTLPITINGGIRSLEAARAHLERLDGVMIGREAYQNPWLLAEADREIYGESSSVPRRIEVLRAYVDYARARCAEGVPLNAMAKHILGLYNGRPGARAWRRHISEHAHRAGVEPSLLLDQVPPEVCA